MKYKWLVPILALGIFLITPFTSFAAPHSTQAVPAVGAIGCASSDYVKIWYNNGHNLECYSGNGYTGPGLSGVTEIDPGNNCGWVVGYLGSKSYKFGMDSFSTYDSYDQVLLYGSPLFNTLTQLDVQGQSCTGNPRLRSTSSHPLSVPHVGIIGCNSSNYVKIWYNNGHSVECFSGNGYTGLGLSGVTEIDPGNNCGWVVVYLGSKSYKLQMNSFFAQYGPPAYNTLTQLDVQGQNCNGTL